MAEKKGVLEQNLYKDTEYGIYEQVINEAVRELIENSNKHGFRSKSDKLVPEGSEEYLARYMQKTLMDGLKAFNNRKTVDSDDSEREEKDTLGRQINACNEIIELLSKLSGNKELLKMKINDERERLLSIYRNHELQRPRSSIAVSRLFTGGSNSEFSLANELNMEIQSANKV